MDFFAHSLSGVLLGQLTAPEKSPSEQGFYIGVCTAGMILPDTDAASYLFGPDAFQAIHQRYTHTLFALLILPPLAALVVRTFHKKHSFRTIWLLFLLAMGVHVAEDLIAHWPVEFFYPLSRKGWSFGLIRQDFSLVVDFLFIIGAGLSFYDRLAPHRRIVAGGTFLAVLFYLLFGPGY